MSPAKKPDDIFPIDPQGDNVLDIHGVSRALAAALYAEDLDSGILAALPALLTDTDNNNDSDEPKGKLSVLIYTARLIRASAYFENFFRSREAENPGEPWRFRIDLPVRPDMEHTRSENDAGLAFLYLLVASWSVADICIRALKGDVDYGEDTLGSESAVALEEKLSWVFIAYVFKREDVFSIATKDVICSSEGKITSDLPIPGIILDTLNTHRAKTLTALTRLLRHLREPILSGCRNKTGLVPSQTDLAESYVNVFPTYISLAVSEDPDNQACVNAVLRAYEDAVNMLGISKAVGPDFEGLSTCGLVERALGIDISEGEEYLENQAHERCSVSWRVRGALRGFEMPGGLELEDFHD
ncbi:hypothetical protein BDW74DRAFT_183963 [Aspergillus multicolor]|uniref:uncharacterized protein n=1 Tax=Aspergillus multicolor TaxID=41759 RepID=UPI003CCDEAF1